MPFNKLFLVFSIVGIGFGWPFGPYMYCSPSGSGGIGVVPFRLLIIIKFLTSLGLSCAIYDTRNPPWECPPNDIFSNFIVSRNLIKKSPWAYP